MVFRRLFYSYAGPYKDGGAGSSPVPPTTKQHFLLRHPITGRFFILITLHLINCPTGLPATGYFPQQERIRKFQKRQNEIIPFFYLKPFQILNNSPKSVFSVHNRSNTLISNRKKRSCHCSDFMFCFVIHMSVCIYGEKIQGRRNGISRKRLACR